MKTGRQLAYEYDGNKQPCEHHMCRFDCLECLTVVFDQAIDDAHAAGYAEAKREIVEIAESALYVCPHTNRLADAIRALLPVATTEEPK